LGRALVVHWLRNAASPALLSPARLALKFHSVIHTGKVVPIVLVISERGAVRWLVQLSMRLRQTSSVSVLEQVVFVPADRVGPRVRRLEVGRVVLIVDRAGYRVRLRQHRVAQRLQPCRRSLAARRRRAGMHPGQ
jgi:hypothetical protein